MMAIQNAIYAALKDIIALIGSIAVAYLSAYLKQHLQVKQLEAARAIAKEAVFFAEQIGDTLGIKGGNKFKAALEKAKVLAAKAGIKLTDDQWQGLIEAAVNVGQQIWDATKPQVTTSAALGNAVSIVKDTATNNAVKATEPAGDNKANAAVDETTTNNTATQNNNTAATK